MAPKHLTEDGTQKTTFQELECSLSLVSEVEQQPIYYAIFNIVLSITAFLGNSIILVALHKESSLHPPSKLLYRCLAVTDLLVGLVSQPCHVSYWMSLVQEHWSLCPYARDAAYITSYALCGVSLSTMTAISVDRLLALLLGLRYRQKVTLKRTYVIIATFWIVCSVAASFFIWNNSSTIWVGRIFIPSCLVISVGSYTKIFRTLSHHQTQVQDHVQQQPSQPNALNMAQYRKAVYSALWVQLALVVCYLPYGIMEIVISHRKTYSSHSAVGREIAIILVYFNSTLNPFLYCWKISEIRRAVRQTIRQALCCLWR